MAKKLKVSNYTNGKPVPASGAYVPGKGFIPVKETKPAKQSGGKR